MLIFPISSNAISINSDPSKEWKEMSCHPATGRASSLPPTAEESAQPSLSTRDGQQGKSMVVRAYFVICDVSHPQIYLQPPSPRGWLHEDLSFKSPGVGSDDSPLIAHPIHFLIHCQFLPLPIPSTSTSSKLFISFEAIPSDGVKRSVRIALTREQGVKRSADCRTPNTWRIRFENCHRGRGSPPVS
jgi:hypothetical protein